MWDSVARYGLHATPYNQIANWAFVDWMLNFREETVLSTIKIRQAGFADCIDTHESSRRQLTGLRDFADHPLMVPRFPSVTVSRLWRRRNHGKFLMNARRM